jgi:hypothetical protein
MRARLLLLGAQTVTLGLTVAFLMVPASALLLHAYGAHSLPYVYLAVAVSGVALSWAMRRAQARLSLAALAMTVLCSYAVLVAAAYAVLTIGDSEWVSFPLVVLFPLSIPVGFFLVGAQAGRLLDVRQMKEHFPRIVGGFSIGFAAGGLLAAWLVHLLSSTADLLLVDLATTGAMLALVAATARRYQEQMRARPPTASATKAETTPRVPLRGLVLTIFCYQVFSTALGQLLDYIVWERAAARYPNAGDIARFQGIYSAAVNIVAIGFVVFLAGRLLTRYGVGLGLAATPAAASILLLAGNLVGWTVGIGGMAFLLMACVQQVGDVTDAMTRTAINSTYHAVPADRRLRARTLVEAAGAPLALGVVGVLLLAIRALGLDVRAVEVVSLLVTVAWLLVAVVAYREYGVGLRSLVLRRAWEPTGLDVEGEAGLGAVQRLLTSADPRDVEVGLGALAASQSPAFADQVGALLSDETPAGVRAGAARASLVGGVSAHAEVGHLLDDPDPGVRATVAAACVDEPGQLGARSREVWAALVDAEAPDVAGHALRAAAVSPSPFFVPHLVEAAGRRVHEGSMSHALAAHAEHLGPAIRTVLVDRDGSRRVRERLVRAVTAAHGRAEPLAFDVATALQHQRVRAARARAALRHLGQLDDSPQLDPLRRALVDDLAALAAETTALLSLATGQRGLARAVRALHSDNPTERALAHETLEVTVGRAHASWVIALVQPDARPAADEPGQVADWLADLVVDGDEVWQEPWLRVCALYAAPTVAADRAVELATPYADDTDPAVSETARWVLTNAAA